MAKYRIRGMPVVDAAYYDGKLVGQRDPVSGRVVPGTCPAWFPAVSLECASVSEALRAVDRQPGKVAVEGGHLYVGTPGGVTIVSPGNMVYGWSDTSVLRTMRREAFEQAYEPVS